jgi:hypothetical protein
MLSSPPVPLSYQFFFDHFFDFCSDFTSNGSSLCNLSVLSPSAAEIEMDSRSKLDVQAAVEAYWTDPCRTISLYVPMPIKKQCRKRRIGQLASSVSREVWSPEKDALLIQEQAMCCNK